VTDFFLSGWQGAPVSTTPHCKPILRRDLDNLIGCSEMGLQGRWLLMALLAVAIVGLAGCAAGPFAEPCGGFFACTDLH
jgi:hypothetical protein